MALPAEELRRHMADLYSQPGVSGACLQLGGLVIVHDLPYSDDRVSNLATRINHLITSYESVGRPIWQICAGYENFWLLILCRGNARLTILLKPNTDPALVSSRATRLLMEVEAPHAMGGPAPAHPGAAAFAALQASQPASPAVAVAAPATNGSHGGMPRDEFERFVGGLLGRVTGSSQAIKLVQREMVKAQVSDSADLEKETARRIGLAILEYIPNRGKRSALAAEFLNTLDS